MGSGKKTYGSMLAQRINYQFIDIDNYIELKENKTISELFREKGEEYFRNKESFYLKELLNFNKKLVLSLGGGTPMREENLREINANSVSIYLNASVDTLFAYLRTAKSKRPIIKDLNDEELHSFIEKHLAERKSSYEQARVQVVTDNKWVDEVVDELLRVVEKVDEK